MWCGCQGRRVSASFASSRALGGDAFQLLIVVERASAEDLHARRGEGLIRRRRALACVHVSLAALLHAIGFVGSIAVPSSVDHGPLGEAAVVSVVCSPCSTAVQWCARGFCYVIALRPSAIAGWLAPNRRPVTAEPLWHTPWQSHPGNRLPSKSEASMIARSLPSRTGYLLRGHRCRHGRGGGRCRSRCRRARLRGGPGWRPLRRARFGVGQAHDRVYGDGVVAVGEVAQHPSGRDRTPVVARRR